MKQLTIVAFVLVLIACGSNKKNDIVNTSIHQEWYGNWVGDFMAEEFKDNLDDLSNTKINIRIISINKENDVIGQSVVAGNKRPLKGSFDEVTDKFVLKEPGNNKYDGVFEFVVKGDTLIGTWIANDKSLNITKRTFVLVQKQFVYNKMLMLPSNLNDEEGGYIDYSVSHDRIIKEEMDDSTYTYIEKMYRVASDAVTTINASTKELKETDLKNLKKLDLEIIRNTIYARHGFTFGKKSVRQFFDFVEWYIPVNDDVESQLTSLELKNIALLKRFEKYAEDNYDTFGR